jgi:predicted alpha/beta superfamily hydrolase
VSALEFQRRRTYDFMVEHALLSPGYQRLEPDAVGGAPRFRDFLIDELRAQLGAEYRLDGEHGLAGHSGGAMFAAFTLFTRPDGFSRYLISSPGDGFDFRRMEADYAERASDLVARVFITAGGRDLTDFGGATGGIWSATSSLTEALVARQYPSLQLSATVLPGQTHMSAWPIAFVEGIRALWPESRRVFGTEAAQAIEETYKEFLGREPSTETSR